MSLIQCNLNDGILSMIEAISKTKLHRNSNSWFEIVFWNENETTSSYLFYVLFYFGCIK